MSRQAHLWSLVYILFLRPKICKRRERASISKDITWLLLAVSAEFSSPGECLTLLILGFRLLMTYGV